MKIIARIPLAFGATIGLLLLGACIGIYKLNAALHYFEHQVLNTVAQHKLVVAIENDFAGGVQEWKNVLLRGKNPNDREAYWVAHQKKMSRVKTGLGELDEGHLTEAALKLREQIKSKLDGLAAVYAGAYKAYVDSGGDSQTGDQYAKGKDREVATLLSDLRLTLSKAEEEKTLTASQSAGSGTAIAAVILAIVSVLGIVNGILLTKQIVKPLLKASRIAEAVASGHLDNVIDVRGNDEIADLMKSLRTMQQSLVQLVSDVLSGAESVAAASAEIAHGNLDLSARTEQQAGALEETASSMEQLSSTVQQNSGNASQADQLAQQAATVAIRGGAAVDQVVETMKEINESSRRISDITSVIDAMAFQTNILALNAAVEAARAGEHGRGFAVVASEVRVLAGRSAEAAREIKGLIWASVERVEQGSTLVDGAGTTMKEVVSSIQRVTEIMSSITEASKEQASGVKQASEAVMHMDTATQQNAALVEQMSAAAQSLKAQSDDLVKAVAAFTINRNGPSGHGELT